MPDKIRPSLTTREGHETAGARGPPAARNGFAVVGIGASAGGLEACTKLLASLPPHSGMAFILIQHLDPTHESMMVDLLSGHTAMSVLQATDGMVIQPDYFYIIPPGTYLSVKGGILRLSAPEARHGARLPVDFLLRSLADSYGPQAICVILSGTGTDGCLGLKAVKEKCGLVIAQDPAEAGFAGMPSAAIATGSVDLILPIAGMQSALLRYARRIGQAQTEPGTAARQADWLPDIIGLLRSQTTHDFTLYKPGTLQRRVERRMAMASIDSDSMDKYLALLRHDPAEMELLARDLLINVTSFFRDPAVFETMERSVVPDLIRACKPDQTLRIWVAGCSTGEETYSLAMIFREQIQVLDSAVKLQVFASDVDPDAVAAAREGLYPDSIGVTVSAARLARFFTRVEHGYRISPDLRAAVVFTVQDVLADPPFSRLDLVSCRNLLIYLLPEAQARVISVFHFALREGGVLLLGSAETVGAATARFEVIAKRERIYRHVGRSRPGEHDFLQSSADGARLRTVPGLAPNPGQQADLAELGRRLVLDAFAPAAVLINRAHECLFSLGPTDRFLRVPKGHSSMDVLAMARAGLRSKLAAAIRQAIDTKARVVVTGARMLGETGSGTVTLDVRPVTSGGEALLLVCFVDDGEVSDDPRDAALATPARAGDHGHTPKEADLARALAAAQADLKSVTQDLEASAEEQKAATQEALSINEEYQSTNEGLLTSKEELQSLNEELSALNSQLQETLERQRKTSDDLQNVLYSTDVATLFLNAALKIRFFTPATKSVYHVIAGDIGRPLADLHSLVPDSEFSQDAQAVLRGLKPMEREIETPDGACFIRRIMPYKTAADGAAGLVITFTDTTDRKSAGRALEAAQRSSEAANAAKSRFLAAASHDLRQPLQTLALLQGLLGRSVSVASQQTLVARMGDTVGAMSGMLNTLLDINQIDAGIVKPDFSVFRLDDVLLRLRDEMAYQADAQGLRFRVVPSGLTVRSDPVLLEQMIRNLVANAFKYTKTGGVLLGCRRGDVSVRIEIWDTGIGIEARELRAIFEEYHQLDNAARERSRGLGLGLPIVQRLGNLLGHKIGVRSWPGRGSVFTIDIPCVPSALAPAPAASSPVDAPPPARTGTVLLVEDDPDIADLLEEFLKAEGHRVTTEHDGRSALAHIEHAALQPDVILSDYNLPNGQNGLQVAASIRAALHRPIPVIILTGDISTDTLRRVTGDDCLYLGKPVKLPALTEAIQASLPANTAAAHVGGGGKAAQTVFVVDDNEHVRNALRAAVQEDGRMAETFENSEAFLLGYKPGQVGCLLIDANLPGMSGLDLLRHLRSAGDPLPALMITGNSEVSMAVEAMKAGADDFIEKPIGYRDLLDAIDKAVEHGLDGAKRMAWRDTAAQHIADLTARQKQIMDLVLAGQPSKNIAADLGISQRTVENHRASIMKRTGSHSLPALARLAVTAAMSAAEE